MDLCDIREVRSLLDRHGFRFSKSMGQNFVSVELDPSLPPVLAETMAGEDNFVLVSGDVLKLDIGQLVEEHFQGLTPLVCANLPYNAATPILHALVESGRFEALTVMVQREVAQRLAAKPGTGAYGALSVFMQYYTRPELLFDVPPECFLPAPKVTSSVIRCQRRERPAVDHRCGVEFFFRVVGASFALRRKTLCNSLCTAFGSRLGKEGVAAVIARCGLAPSIRGEALDLGQFAALADGLWEALGNS
ncbi:MAG: ribosomal RNA small subunit methyltransferase A [Oscillospiraceae bacterium]|nr:ribosomal RNA small subunit methyltransferase A [Oscillospiraceae bacterium]